MRGRERLEQEARRAEQHVSRGDSVFGEDADAGARRAARYQRGVDVKDVFFVVAFAIRVRDAIGEPAAEQRVLPPERF